MEKIYIGANYYPEDWDESQIDWDIAKMQENGFNVIRIGEFAWAKDEPVEGEYHFEWLHDIVDRFGKAGIRVIMGTPSATPPHWLYQKYPDMAVVHAYGAQSHGGRRHCCSSNPHYQKYSAIIAEKLAQEFGSDPNILGWQIDNEIYPTEDGCYCPYCKSRFHQFLREKYGTVENINASWNLNLFSQKYDSIEEIPIPINTWHNPHIKQDWALSQAKNHVDFIHMQAEIIRRYSSAPMGTDTMPFNAIDYRQMETGLDVVQFNHYNTPENIHKAAMWYDYMRQFSARPFWNTETQPCWNGSTAFGMPLLDENFIYLNTCLPIVLGGEANLYWLWRTHWAGHELMHGAVYDSCGRPTYANGEIRRAVADLTKAEKFLTSTKVANDSAIHYTALNEIMRNTQDINCSLKPMQEEICAFYKQTFEAGVHSDLIDLQEDLGKYKLIFSYLNHTLEVGNFRERITKWVENGGVWVAGPLTNIRTANGTKYKTAPYGFLEELTGAHLRYTLPDDNGHLTVENELGQTVSCGKTYELFDDEVGQPLLTVTKGHSVMVGTKCAAVYSVGKGKVILLGTMPEEQEMKRIIRYAASLAHATVFDTEGAFVTARVGAETSGEIALSMSGKEATYRFAGTKKDILTGEVCKGEVHLKPYQIAVLENI